MVKIIPVEKDSIHSRIDKWLKKKICYVPQALIEKSLRNKYITLVQEINKEYEQIQDLMKDIHPFLIDQEPEVIILHENYEYKKVKKEKKKK